MRDVQLYQRVLGLSAPWRVSRVDLKIKEHRVDIGVEHRPGVKWRCPHCPDSSKKLSCRDHAEERVWRHLDTCLFQTYLHARIPRMACPEHGVVNVSVP